MKNIKNRIVAMAIAAVSTFAGAGIINTVPVSADSTTADKVHHEKQAQPNKSGYKLQNVNISGGGGFVPGIIYNPTEEGLVYCRTDMGGIYRRDKTTKEWLPLTDFVSPDEWNLLGGESLATDPVETNRVYAALGTYTNSWTTMNGYIYRSEDYGETWDRVEMPFKFGGNMPGRSEGERLMVDPSANNILYFGARGCVKDGVAVSNGLWKSTDYGKTWEKVTSLPTNIGMYAEDDRYEYSSSPIGITWIAFDTSNTPAGEPTKDIYLGAADAGVESIYHSSDAGKTWKTIPGQPTEFHVSSDGQRSTGFSHHGVLSSTGQLYITYNSHAGPYQGENGVVYKYDTKTGEWTNITPPSGYDWDGVTPKYENYYGYGGIAVDAQNPDTLIVTSLQSWWPDNYIWRSTDAGATWDCIWEWGSGYMQRQLKYTMDVSKAPWLYWGVEGNADKGGLLDSDASQNPAPKLGWMMGDIEINPFNSDEMLYGTGATIYGSDNLTKWDTWKDWDAWKEDAVEGEYVNISMQASGVEETAVLSLISPPGETELVAGVGDICGFVYKDVTQNPQSMMTNPIFTSTTGLDYAELNPDTIVRVGNINKEQYEDIKKSIAISKDGGETWSEVQPNVSYSFEPFEVTDEAGETSLKIAEGGTIAVGADGKNYVWAPSGFEKVVTYVDGNWKQASGLAGDSYVCSDRVNGNKFYAFKDGTLFVSTDGGVTFKKTLEKLSYNTAKIKAVPGKEGHVWIPAGNDGLLFSTDSGNTVQRAKGVARCDVVGFGKAKEGSDYMSIYICGEVNGIYGVYRSDDMAKSWTRVNDDDHQYGSINYAITGDPDLYGRVYFGTNGRGVVYADLVGEEETVEALKGDVNCDGVVNADDTKLLKKALCISMEQYLTEQGGKNADMNGDGKVNALDQMLITKYILENK